MRRRWSESRLRSWWLCRRECGVEWHNGHPWVVFSCDRPQCPAAAWANARKVTP